MSEPTPEQQKQWTALILRGLVECQATNEELKKILAKLHERFMGEDSDKVIGEMNHRIKQAVEKKILEVEQKNPLLAAYMDDLGRSGDKAPPQNN